MADAVPTMMEMAKARPDPKAVSQWLSAYLGKRPLEMKRALLDGFETEIKTKYASAEHTRAATLVLKMIQKVRESLR